MMYVPLNMANWPDWYLRKSHSSYNLEPRFELLERCERMFPSDAECAGLRKYLVEDALEHLALDAGTLTHLDWRCAQLTV